MFKKLIIVPIFLVTACTTPKSNLRMPQQTEVVSSMSLDDEGSNMFKYDYSSALNIMQSVKFIVHLDAQKAPKSIVFQNTNKFKFHADYLLTTPKYQGLTREQIDKISLADGPQRELILGTLFFRTTDDTTKAYYGYEVVSTDLTPVKTVNAIHQLLKKSSPLTFNQSALEYMASGQKRLEIIAQTSELELAGIKIWDPFKNLTSVNYAEGWAVGKVVVASLTGYEALVAQGVIDQDTILVMDQVPREIPPLAAIITAQPTATSSHVALLAGMFQIPFAYDGDLVKRAQALNGQYAYLKVGPGRSKFKPITQSTFAELSRAKKPELLKIVQDLSKKAIVPAKNLSDADLAAYGGKAVRVGLIQRAVPASAPSYALGIPTYFFKEYLRSATMPNNKNLGVFIQTKLADLKKSQMTYAQMGAVLGEIRTAMKDTPVPDALTHAIGGELAKLIPSTVERVKLRSSSNVEDGNEFNGAGLYDSEGVWLNNAPPGKETDFAKGLNKVWRSLYSERGYLARRYFQVDENQVAMGILVQETFKNEKANGVALFIPKVQQFGSDTIKSSSFPGEESSVTNPLGVDTPEVAEMDYRDHIQAWGVNYVEKTNLLPVGRTVLTEEQYQELATKVMQVVSKWNGPVPRQGLDFEWKLIQRNNKDIILLKQVRALPLARTEKLPDNSPFFLLGESLENYAVIPPERPAAYGLHFCPSTVAIQVPSASAKNLKLVTNLPLVQFSLKGKRYEFKNLPLKTVIGQSQGKTTFGLEFAAPIDDYKPLKFSLARTFSDQSFVVDELFGSVGGDALDLKVASPFFEDLDGYACSLNGDVFSGIVPDMPEQRFDGTITMGKDKIEFFSKYRPGGMYEKTAFLNIDKVVFTGFGVAQPFTIEIPRAAVYAPAHHNFDWGLSFDLKHASLSEAEKKKVFAKYGRYFMFKLPEQGAWLTEDKKIKPVQVKIKTSNPFEGGFGGGVGVGGPM